MLRKKKKYQIADLKKCWFDYSIVNLSDIDESNFSNKDHDMKQSINLNNYFVLDHFYVFVSVQLEIKSNFKNAYQNAEFCDYVF